MAQCMCGSEDHLRAWFSQGIRLRSKRLYLLGHLTELILCNWPLKNTHYHNLFQSLHLLGQALIILIHLWGSGTYKCTQVCVSAHMRRQNQTRALFLDYFLPYCLGTGSLTEPEAHCLVKLACQRALKTNLAHLSVLGLQAHTASFLHRCWRF